MKFSKNVQIRSRPLRIAFLVNVETGNSTELVVKIIRFATKCWGGGYFPIIPCNGIKINEYWWKLLLHYDPDIICTTLDLDSNLVSRIYKEVAPFNVEKSDSEFSHRLNPLSCLHIPSYLSQVKTYNWEKVPIYLCLPHTSKPGEHDSFFRINYGLIDQTVSNDFLFDSPEILKKVITNETTPENFIQNCSPHNTSKPLYPKDISKLWCQAPFSVKHNSIANAFHLVVGNSAEDLIWAWNRSLVSSDHNGRDILWLPEDYINEDANFDKTLDEWLQRVYWDNTAHQRFGYIISSSMTNEKLELFNAKLQRIVRSIHWTTCGDPTELYGKLEFEPYWKPASIGNTLEDVGVTTICDCSFRIYPSELTKLTRLQPTIPPFVINQNSTGELVADLDYEYQPSKIEHRSSLLRLPKRYGVTQSLFRNRKSRSSFSGKLSVCFTYNEPCIDMIEPSMHAILSSCGYDIPNDIDHLKTFISPMYAFETSSAGNALIRVLEIFGSLEMAAQFFEDTFWVYLGLFFCNLQTIESQNAKELRILETGLKNSMNTIPEMKNLSEDSVKQLASHLIGKLNRWNTCEKYFSIKQIKNYFNSFRGKLLKSQNGMSEWQHVDFDYHYLPYLEVFLRRGVFRMGAELKCSSCGHKAWFLLENIRHVSKCNVCGSDIEIPLTFVWTLKLHDIVKEAIVGNSLPLIIRELHNQQIDLNKMFDFLPCQDVYSKDSESPITDLDLVVFKEGKLIIGEVKSEPSRLTKNELLKLSSIAEVLRPQEVLVVTQDGEFNADTQEELDIMKKHLDDQGITLIVKRLKRINTWTN